MTKDEIAMELYRMNEQFVNRKWLLRGLFSSVDYKRDMYIWFTKVSAKMAVEALKQRVNPFNVEHYQSLVNQIGMTPKRCICRRSSQYPLCDGTHTGQSWCGQTPSEQITRLVIASPALSSLAEWWAVVVNGKTITETTECHTRNH